MPTTDAPPPLKYPDLRNYLAGSLVRPTADAASVFTESGGIARKVMERASAGMIGVNVGASVPRESFSFGGWNESRFGGRHHRPGIDRALDSDQEADHKVEHDREVARP